jgi:tetratricopeptide (TPR) repeat protein
MHSVKPRDYLLDCILLVCASAAVYGRLIGCSFQTHWDDNIYILNNVTSHGFSWEHVRSAFSFWTNRIGQYNPLSLLSFMLDYSLWGADPAGYHLTNIVIHTLNGLLVYRLLLRLHGERLLSLVAAAVFLLHPVQVESVGWIAERKGLLSLFFVLLSWEWYCRYKEAGKGQGRLSYAVSLVAFTLSLMAKTAGVVLPVILIFYDMCFAKETRRIRFLDKIPFFLASAVFSIIEIYSEMPQQGGSLAEYHGGTPLTTFYTMLPVFCRYLRLLLWPSGLNIEHMPPVYQSLELKVVAAAVLLAAMFFAAFRLYRVDRRLGFWVMFFWVGLLPVSQIVPLFMLMYEHYLYMPIIGAGALAGAGAVCIRERIGSQRSVILYGILVLWLLTLSVVSFQRTAVWNNSLTLFTDASLKSPQSFRVWEIIGETQHYFGNISASRQALERSLSIKSDNTDVLWALGKIHIDAGELEKGYNYLQRLLVKNPAFARGWATLGDYYRARGDYRTAEVMYSKALFIQPDAVQVQMMLGKLALLERRLDDARSFLGRVEADGREWNAAENAYLMTCVESLAGRTDSALVWLEKALERGYQDYYTLNTNLELSELWKDPRFSYLMMKYFPDQENRR